MMKKDLVLRRERQLSIQHACGLDLAVGSFQTETLPVVLVNGFNLISQSPQEVCAPVHAEEVYSAAPQIRRLCRGHLPRTQSTSKPVIKVPPLQ